MNKLGNNSKTAKSEKYGYNNLIMHFSPMKRAYIILKTHEKQVLKLVKKRLKRDINFKEYQIIKNFQACNFFGACGKYCLDTSGRGRFSSVQIARSAKTIHYILEKDNFDTELKKEVIKEHKKAIKKNTKLAIRLNGTSDCNFTYIFEYFYNLKNENFKFNKIEYKTSFKKIQWYDYTKNIALYKQFLKGLLTKNYYMTFSYDRGNHKKIKNYENTLLEILEMGGKIAIIDTDLKNIIKNNPSFENYKKINGDNHDLRFLDKKINGGAFVVLNLKKTYN